MSAPRLAALGGEAPGSLLWREAVLSESHAETKLTKQHRSPLQLFECE